MENTLLTTGKAAALCSVAPDTVRKWIASGRLPSTRTAGGHNRIRREDLAKLVDLPPLAKLVDLPPSEPRATVTEPQKGAPVYCWEYNGRGEVLNGCRKCAVFKMHALHCYEVANHVDTGHQHIFCQQSCQECDYYRRMHDVEVCDGNRQDLLADMRNPTIRLVLTASPGSLSGRHEREVFAQLEEPDDE